MSIVLPDFSSEHASADTTGHPPIGLVPHERITELAEATERLFPGQVVVKIEEDPEIEDEWYFVFKVQAAWDLSSLKTRRRQWHQISEKLLPDSCDKLRLSIGIAE